MVNTDVYIILTITDLRRRVLTLTDLLELTCILLTLTDLPLSILYTLTVDRFI